jgi:hypothetical protein
VSPLIDNGLALRLGVVHITGCVDQILAMLAAEFVVFDIGGAGASMLREATTSSTTKIILSSPFRPLMLQRNVL